MTNEDIIQQLKDKVGDHFVPQWIDIKNLEEVLNLARADERKRIVEDIKSFMRNTVQHEIPSLNKEVPITVISLQSLKRVLSRIEADEQSLKSNNE